MGLSFRGLTQSTTQSCIDIIASFCCYEVDLVFATNMSCSMCQYKLLSFAQSTRIFTDGYDKYSVISGLKHRMSSIKTQTLLKRFKLLVMCLSSQGLEYLELL
jgi:hypothetical protein